MDSQTFCFSTTSILRCESTSGLKIYLLIIPPAIEVLFAVTLLIANWSNGRRHLWITAEGCIYFSLVLIEMLTHILPAVRDHLNIFKVFDIVLAAASSIPIFCYLFFVFLFARAELIDILPRRFQMIPKFILLMLIPIIVTLSELASFIGVSHHEVTNRPTLVFPNDRNKNIWSFFTSLTLALFAAYQFMAFCLAFYRLIRTLITQRLNEVTASDETQFLRGTSWVTVGLKLGEIETIIGFAANAYWSAMTRRIVRLLARASLIIGLIKGLDTIENFTVLGDEPTESIGATEHRSFRRSRLQESVSSPRLSTLRPLGAAAFHSPPLVPQDLPLSPPQSESGLLASKKSAQVKPLKSERRVLADGLNRERVTVHLENGTPRLRMRFSALEIPKFPISTPNLSYTATEVAKKPWPSAPRPAAFPFRPDPSDFSSPSNALGTELMPKTWPDSTKGTPSTKDALLSRESPKVYPRSPKEMSIESLYSIPTRRGSPVDSYTSLSTVRELAAQFPPLPTRILESNEQFAVNNGTAVDFWDDSPSGSPRASVGTLASSREFVATPFTTGQKYSKTTTSTTTRYLDVTAPDSIATTPTTTISGFMTTPAKSTSTALTDEPSMDLTPAGGSTKSQSFGKDTSGVVAPTRDPVDWIDFDGIPGPSLPPVIEETGEGKVRQSQQSGSTDSLRISWLHNSEEPQLAQAVSVKSQVARIKSIGKAPIRVTPRPIKNGHRRDSLHIERIQVPSNEDAYNLGVVRGSTKHSDD